MSMNSDFSDFLKGEESKKPAFQVRSDWREEIVKQAIINGDLASDATPDTSLTADYWDPTPDEAIEEVYLDESGNPPSSW